MKIEFEDGGYVEIKKSDHLFDQIFVIVATKESSLKLNVNTATLNKAQFSLMCKDVFRLTKEENNGNQGSIKEYQEDREDQYAESGFEASTSEWEVDSEESA